MTLVQVADRMRALGASGYAGRLSELERMKRGWTLHTLQIVAAGLGVGPIELLIEDKDLKALGVLKAYSSQGITGVMRWAAEAMELEKR
jgi:hypothetical protein